MVVHPTDVCAYELSLLQCGTFARWQLVARGIDDSSIQRRIDSGHWLRRGPGVYGLAGHADSFEQRLWIGWLAVGPDAVVSHESAAELHGIPDLPRGRVTLIARHPTHHRVRDSMVHQINDVLPEHRTAVRGLPTTTVARTIVDLAGWVHPSRVLHLTEHAKHARLVTYEEIGTVLASVARRGKPGVGRLARVLDTLDGRGGVEQSVLERQLLRLLKDHRLPPPVLQMPHPGRSLPSSCVDAGYPEAKLAVEADGRRWHSRVADVKRDRERDGEAARHGWQTLRVLHEHIVDDPDGTASLVRDVLATRLSQLAS